MHKFRNWLGPFLSGIAIVMTLFHMTVASPWVNMNAQLLREIHVAFVLLLTFLLFPCVKSLRHRMMWWPLVPPTPTIRATHLLTWRGSFGSLAFLKKEDENGTSDSGGDFSKQ